MANYVAILKKGMDMTPGGKTEEAVPPAERLGEEVDLERRVQLLVDTTCLVLFNYVAQVSPCYKHVGGNSMVLWSSSGCKLPCSLFDCKWLDSSLLAGICTTSQAEWRDSPCNFLLCVCWCLMWLAGLV